MTPLEKSKQVKDFFESLPNETVICAVLELASNSETMRRILNKSSVKEMVRTVYNMFPLTEEEEKDSLKVARCLESIETVVQWQVYKQFAIRFVDFVLEHKDKN